MDVRELLLPAPDDSIFGPDISMTDQVFDLVDFDGSRRKFRVLDTKVIDQGHRVKLQVMTHPKITRLVIPHTRRTLDCTQRPRGWSFAHKRPWRGLLEVGHSHACTQRCTHAPARATPCSSRAC